MISLIIDCLIAVFMIPFHKFSETKKVSATFKTTLPTNPITSFNEWIVYIFNEANKN